MRPGDPVQYFERPGPGNGVAARITGRYGSHWADVRTDDGRAFEWVRIAPAHGYSPKGNYCLPPPGGDRVPPPAHSGGLRPPDSDA